MNIFKKIKKLFFLKENIISLLVVIFVFVLDRFSKINIINNQLNNKSLFINDFLNFDLVWNTGISFGLFSQNANIYYHIISILIFLVIVFLSYLISKAKIIDKILYSLILGGGLGNFYDRLVYFAVPDFIDVHINEFHWFTFNIADIFITIGIIILIVKDVIIIKK
jgi:signal peptidase II|tara:strand:- start:24 stop:521 length:498 start_codon:yes stop_codon:yes gene_type:complete